MPFSLKRPSWDGLRRLFQNSVPAFRRGWHNAFCPISERVTLVLGHLFGGFGEEALNRPSRHEIMGQMEEVKAFLEGPARCLLPSSDEPAIYGLWLTRTVAETVTRRLERNPSLLGIGICGFNRTKTCNWVMVRELQWANSSAALLLLPMTEAILLMTGVRTEGEREAAKQRLWQEAQAISSLPLPLLLLLWGVEGQRGWFKGWVWLPDGKIYPLKEICFAGHGMRCWRRRLTAPKDAQRWQRTRAALGDEAWQLLHQCHFAIVGCGRSGSQLAIALAKLGVQSLTLIDGDRVEEANLGEMDGVMEEDVGRLKVEALADFLSSLPSAPKVRRVTEFLPSPEALTALKEADVLCCCADERQAHFWTGLMAAFYQKPLLDIGTGVIENEAGRRRYGMEVRWLLPGESCLVCAGGTGEHGWHQVGALRSLNGIAVQMGMRLIENWAQGNQTSVWVRGEFAEIGMFYERVWLPESRNCWLCALSGIGDRIVQAPKEGLEQAWEGRVLFLSQGQRTAYSIGRLMGATLSFLLFPLVAVFAAVLGFTLSFLLFPLVAVFAAVLGLIRLFQWLSQS